MLNVGDVAPVFALESDTGDTVRLADLRGKRVILYFYPRDNTPGCTTEACEFRDRTPQLEKQNAIVLGVSPDSVKSHAKFKGKYKLPFTLLSDPDHAVAEAYGAWGEKKMYGKTRRGTIRSTFVIDEEGVIAEVYEKVKAKGHAERVLDDLT